MKDKCYREDIFIPLLVSLYILRPSSLYEITNKKTFNKNTSTGTSKYNMYLISDQFADIECAIKFENKIHLK